MVVVGIHDAPLDDADVARSWAASGCRWLTDPDVAVPGALVRRVLGLVGQLDARGAGLASIVAADGLGLLAERAALMGLPPASDVSAGGAGRLVRTADGWIALSLARSADEALVPAWLEAPAPEGQEWDVVHDRAAGRTAAELVERASLLGLPCSVVGEVDDRRPAIATPIADAAPRPISDTLVVDLASLWAGPLCADVLARLGARLVTVESTGRPDGGRLARRFFAALHGRSESVALDFGSATGRARLGQLLERADVVIEGSRPRALEQLGFDVRELARRGPQVWISITSHGRGDTNRDRVGFGDDAAAAGGLVGWVDGTPRFVADAVADPLTGLTAAVTAVELLERGGRWLVDVALARCTAAATGGWIDTDTERWTAERPRPRSDRGASMPLGRDTDRIIRELG